MKRPMPWNEQVDVILSDESSASDADMEADNGSGAIESTDDTANDEPAKEIRDEAVVIKRAELYQNYMKQIPIPTPRGSVIPFTTWMGLAKSMKQLYGQPLHYLTNILLKQWDRLRIGTEDEHSPLDTIIHPTKAESNIWLIEEVHRRTSSPLHVAKLWQADPMHHTFVDSIFPDLRKRS